MGVMATPYYFYPCSLLLSHGFFHSLPTLLFGSLVCESTGYHVIFLIETVYMSPVSQTTFPSLTWFWSGFYLSSTKQTRTRDEQERFGDGRVPCNHGQSQSWKVGRSAIC